MHGCIGCRKVSRSACEIDRNVRQIRLPQFIYADEPFANPRDGPTLGPVAVGGDLSPKRLLQAYANGIFPWFNDDKDPVLWWSPDPRCILLTDSFHASRSLAKWCRRRRWLATVDTSFDEIVDQCSRPRVQQESSWITNKMKAAYTELHHLGYAHSLEVWSGNQIVGGIYGVSLGAHFYGESMFSARTNGSKVALLALCRLLNSWGFRFVDCQLPTPHLESLGATRVDRASFLHDVIANRKIETIRGPWRVRPFIPQVVG